MPLLACALLKYLHTELGKVDTHGIFFAQSFNGYNFLFKPIALFQPYAIGLIMKVSILYEKNCVQRRNTFLSQ